MMLTAFAQAGLRRRPCHVIIYQMLLCGRLRSERCNTSLACGCERAECVGLGVDVNRRSIKAVLSVAAAIRSYQLQQNSCNSVHPHAKKFQVLFCCNCIWNAVCYEGVHITASKA